MKEKIIIKFYDKEYISVWSEKESCWIGKIADITFKIYKK